jgi:subtilase family serine protease
MGKILANHLKKLYLLYNRNTVNDDMIIKQLKELSGGMIVLPEDFQLFSTKDIMKSNGNAHYVQVGSNRKAGKKSKRKKRKPQQSAM